MQHLFISSSSILLFVVVITLAFLSFTTSTTPSSLFVTAQQQCDHTNPNICESGEAWGATTNADSPTGCNCFCNNAYRGEYICKCLNNTNAACDACKTEGTVQWFLRPEFGVDKKCVRNCDSDLDCSGNADAIFYPPDPSDRDAAVFPPRSNCGCRCRNSWMTVPHDADLPGTFVPGSRNPCNYCPIQYDQNEDCTQCGNGFSGTYPDDCVRNCNSQNDCNSNSVNVTGQWIGNISNCKCTCKDQWAQPDCKKCPYPYAINPVTDSCDMCADNRDQSTYPDCNGFCNISLNCTSPENVESVSRVGGACQCSCRLAWQGDNASDCSVCDLKTSVMRRGDCYPKTSTHELTETDSHSFTSSESHSTSETSSPSSTLSETQSESDSSSSSASVSSSSSLSESRSITDPSPSLSDSIPETKSKFTYSLTKSETLSVEPTASDTIVVCFMRDCGNGTADTFYSNTSRRCLCTCRSRWENETKCETCPFNFNNTMRPEGVQYLLEQRQREQEAAQQQQQIIDNGGTTTTTTELPIWSPSYTPPPVYNPQSNVSDFYFHDCDYCALGFYNQTSIQEFPDTAKCDCASHAVTELSVDTAVGVPENVTLFAGAFSEDLTSYLESKCFGILRFYAFPFSSVVDLGTNRIRTQIEVIALTPANLDFSACLLKPAATACMMSALTDPSLTEAPQGGGNGGPQLAPRKFCIPIKKLHNITNATDECFTAHANPRSIPESNSPSIPSDSILPLELPYSPCANVSRLNCPVFDEFEVIPAPTPDNLWLILVILGAVLLFLLLLALCCWKYYPFFAAWKERKRKQKRDEMLQALREAELEEQMMLQEELLQDKDADCMVVDDDEISDVSTCSDDDEYLKKMKNNPPPLSLKKPPPRQPLSSIVEADSVSSPLSKTKNRNVEDENSANEDNSSEHREELEKNLLKEELGVDIERMSPSSGAAAADDWTSPVKRADLSRLTNKNRNRNNKTRRHDPEIVIGGTVDTNNDNNNNNNNENYQFQEEEPDLDSLLYSADDFSNHQNSDSNGNQPRRLTKDELDKQGQILKSGIIEDSFANTPPFPSAIPFEEEGQLSAADPATNNRSPRKKRSRERRGRNLNDEGDNGDDAPRTPSGRKSRHLKFQASALDGKDVWEKLPKQIDLNDI